MVSGVGGIIGYGVLRSLRLGYPEATLIGTDIYPAAVGRNWTDTFLMSPLAASGQWADWLVTTLSDQRIDIFIPTLDPELDRFTLNPDLAASARSQVAHPGNRTLQVAQDKLRYYQQFRDHPATIPTLPVGPYAEMKARLGSPFILKPRSGYGSRGVRTIRTREEFNEVVDVRGYIAQQHVGTDDEEYTVGVFGDGCGGVAAQITLKRWLSPEGSTARAQTSPTPPSMSEAILHIARQLKPVGPFNIQFRMDRGQAKVLEINARISSTASIRTALGYNEAQMLVDYMLGGRLPRQPVIREGEATRYVEDLVTFK